MNVYNILIFGLIEFSSIEFSLIKLNSTEFKLSNLLCSVQFSRRKFIILHDEMVYLIDLRRVRV